MPEGLNRVMLLGNLGADPELRVTPGGQAVLKLRLATNESYMDRNNVRQERTEWHRVTVWGRRAEALGKFLQKGDSLFVEGRLSTSSYEKNGEKRYSTEVVANNIVLPGRGKGEGARDGGGGGGGRAPARDNSHREQGAGSADAPFDDYAAAGVLVAGAPAAETTTFPSDAWLGTGDSPSRRYGAVGSSTWPSIKMAPVGMSTSAMT
jgi:single stranded DNA-binding protein